MPFVVPGAHKQECILSIYLCFGEFTDPAIFRLTLYRTQPNRGLAYLIPQGLPRANHMNRKQIAMALSAKTPLQRRFVRVARRHHHHRRRRHYHHHHHQLFLSVTVNWRISLIDLFSLYVLFSHFRPRDATLGNSHMHVQMYAWLIKKAKGKFPREHHVVWNGKTKRTCYRRGSISNEQKQGWSDGERNSLLDYQIFRKALPSIIRVLRVVVFEETIALPGFKRK